MDSKLILIGGGGHCHACIDVIESTNNHEILGIIDIKPRIGGEVLGYKIIGEDNDIIKYIEPNINFLITLGHIKSAQYRMSIGLFLESIGGHLATIVSPLAYVSKYSKIGCGSIIMHRAILGPNTIIGNNCIINTNSNIEHDSNLGNYCHVSTHTVINGGCSIGNNVFIGSNATIFQGIKITDNVVIAAGSVVRKNIEVSGVYWNNQLISNE